MPKVQAVLKVEFEAGNAEPEVIDLALDQVLLLQPACRVISKTISEIDGRVVSSREDLQHLNDNNNISGGGGNPSNDVGGDTYRPDYSEHDRDKGQDRRRERGSHIDSYRPGSPEHNLSNSRSLDSYRPLNSSSSHPLTLHPDGYKMEDHGIPPPGPLGTRYDALVDSMVFTTDARSSQPKKKKHRIEHYSPPPASRRDRSASPKASAGLRRSNRLRAASNGEAVRSLPPGSRVGQGRKVSSDETHESRLQERRRGDDDERRRRMRRRSGGEVNPPPSSLEILAPRTVAKDLTGGKSKFEKQQDRHGIAEALRLKNLRANQKVEKARLHFDKQRWGDGEVKQRARLDAIIDQISTFDFSTPSGTNGAMAAGELKTEVETSHPPVETRKKKGAREKKRERWIANSKAAAQSAAQSAAVAAGEVKEGGVAGATTGVGTDTRGGIGDKTLGGSGGGGDDEMQDVNVHIRVDGS